MQVVCREHARILVSYRGVTWAAEEPVEGPSAPIRETATRVSQVRHAASHSASDAGLVFSREGVTRPGGGP